MRKQVLILVILVILTILTGVIVYFQYLPKQNKLNLPAQNQQPSTSRLKTFKSTTLDFTVQLPNKYEIKEGMTFVDFNEGTNSLGVGRATHAFNSLNEFLADIDEKNKTSNINDIKELEISGYPTKVRDEVRGGVKVRMYYIFTPDWVYVFSTDSEFLYSDLDQIAQSFKYTP